MITPANTEEWGGSKERHEAWITEAIWGHRIDYQPFSALMLEFLSMAEGMFRQGTLLAETRPGENTQYIANQSLQLRNILFNNPRLDEIQRNSQGSDDEGWTTWLDEMNSTASLGDKVPADFSYLRSRFDSFQEFASVVRLLRRITVDPGNERSWTVHFIFPIGPAALYEALLEKGDGFERTRRVFTRTGELCYLMLSRASEPLREQIRTRLAPSFSPETARNKLVMRLISTPEPDRGDSKGGTYLPYKSHPAFNRMAQDVVAILNLQLPDQDAFQYLGPLLGLHVYLYGIETAHHWVGEPQTPPIICEILAPKSDLVRRAAVGSYLNNDGLGSRAIRKYLDDTVLSDKALTETLANPELDEQAKKDFFEEHLLKRCAIKRDRLSGSDINEFRQALYNFAEQQFRAGAARGLTALAAGCGLSSKRGTNRYRYAPTDDLLRVLVLANVKAPIEESAFLRLLFERYRIVIGPVEAKTVLPGYLFDESDFKKNRDRLAKHLIGMGLAQRMSDACTYIINPMDVS
ncbi:MAG: hypothetical protein JNM76_10025 [Betaproteobacteria bacterium]|nr:hypothetical protein [Betaproteobacteria bacterium]